MPKDTPSYKKTNLTEMITESGRLPRSWLKHAGSEVKSETRGGLSPYQLPLILTLVPLFTSRQNLILFSELSHGF